MPTVHFTRLALLLAFAAGLVGCANQVVIPEGTPCEVTGTHAPFYKYGPAQSFGADEVMPPGTMVTMIQRGFGFSRVMRENGVTGYVSNDDISPRAPTSAVPPKARPGARPIAGRTGNRVYDGPIRRSAVQPTPGDPLFDVTDLPLPVKDDPPKPELRAAPPGQRPSATPAPEKKN
jgi:hypothetical protein